MTKSEYLQELRAKLSRLPAIERDDAISYYSEYFEDAGDDATAIETLGSPTRLAAQITAEYSARMLEGQNAARRAAQEPEEAPQQPVYDYTQSFSGLEAPSSNYASGSYVPPAVEPSADGSPYASGTRQSSLNWIVYVILGIFALPIALPVAIAIFAVLFSLIVVCIVLVVVFVVVVVALMFSSIATLFTAGFGAMTVASGLLTLGGALVSLGLALLLIPLLIKFVIWLVRAIGKLATKIFNGLKRRTDKV